MSNIIIGTAGHVDHGKTMLIKALTGTDTDRLKAEKERGITIELGFAYFTLDSGERCGIIDVPGHEKFVRNMLAGAGSIDLALFIVAADEGIMPQSREHLEILTLLDIKRGIIVVTKTDLVEDDWLEMVTLDIRGEVKGTFLENAEIIPVSAKSGAGMETLKKCLSDMIQGKTAAKDKTADGQSNVFFTEDSWGKDRDCAPARLPVDRVFLVDGFGTVVTGTLIEGKISAGEEMTLYPTGLKAKVRGLQVHSQSVTTAHRGQRVAVNLSGLKPGDVERGCCLAAAGSMQASDVLEVRLDVVKGTKRKILSGSRLHFYYGTSEVTCRLNLIGRDELIAGQSCYARLNTEEPVALKAGDRFVVRFYSPMETVGGGVVLDSNPQKKGLRDKNAEKLLEIKEKGSFSQKVACVILDRSASFPSVKTLKLNPFNNSDKFDGVIADLAREKEIFLVKDCVLHKDYLAVLGKKCKTVLKAYHIENPLLEGMKKEELRSKLLSKDLSQLFDEILAVLQQQNIVKINGGTVSDKDFKVTLNDGQKRLSGEITKMFFDCGFSTPSYDEAAAKYTKEQKAFKQSVDSLVAGEILIMLTPQIIMHADFYKKALEIVNKLATNGEFSLAQFRDEIQSSRKYAVALLEHFDNKGITKKQGDLRVLSKKQI